MMKKIDLTYMFLNVNEPFYKNSPVRKIIFN